MLWWLFRQILEFQKKILLDRKLCYRRSVCTYISIPTIYMYKVESIECIVWLSYQTPCWSVLEVWKFKLEKLSLTNWIYSLQKSISKLIFADYTGSKNPVCRTWFFQIDFSEIKYRSTGGKSYNIGASLLCLRFNVCLNGYHKRNQLTREQEIYIPSLYIHSRPVMCIHYSLLSVMAEKKNDIFLSIFLQRVSIVLSYDCEKSRVFLLCHLWIINYYVKSLWNNLSNEIVIVNTGVSWEVPFWK